MATIPRTYRSSIPLTSARLTRPIAGIVPITLCCVAAALRLFRIDHDSLVFDEAYTLVFARMPLDRLLTVGGAHEHPPLYYLLVHLGLWVRDSFLVPRLISAAAGSLSVFVLYRLGARRFGAPAGVVAAGLLATSPFHLWYSQVGRGYEVATLLVLLSYLSLWSALDETPLADALLPLSRLASLVQVPAAGNSFDSLVAWYAADGWRADRGRRRVGASR